MMRSFTDLGFAECQHSVNSGHHYKPHMHTRFSIGAIDGGEVLYNVGGHEASLTSGSLALINPEVLHACNPLQKQERSYYMLYLDTSWCAGLQGLQDFQKIDTILLKDTTLFEHYIKTMEFVMCKNFLMEKEERLTSLVEAIFERVGFSTQKESLHVERAKEILATALDEELLLEEVAASLHVKPITLLRNFKTEVGITPHAFRMNCRIEKARKLLQEGMDVVDVALECGFFDQSHFHRHFKAMTTTTPKAYQRNFIQ